MWKTLVCISFSVTLVGAICDIDDCTKNRSPFIPMSCGEYTEYLRCVKKEYDSCTNDAGRSRVMMGIYFSGGSDDNSVAFCGYDMTQIRNMMTAHAGLMMSIYNNSGPGIRMMGDDGPFDRLDDGPFDNDGPFDDDDGPFDDDGPLDGMDDGRMMHPGLMNPMANNVQANQNRNGAQNSNGGARGATMQQPIPPAPTVQPAFRGGAARQVVGRNSATNMHPRGWIFHISCVICLFIFNFK